MAEASQATEVAFTQANKPAVEESTGPQDAQERAIYELGYHIIPTTPEAEVEKVYQTIRRYITEAEGEVLSESAAKRMTLAYRIERSISGKREKYTESYFGWVKFKAEPQVMPALAKKLQDTYDVLRYLIIETVQEDAPLPRRAVFLSDRLEGATIQKPTAAVEKDEEVSEEDLDKSIDAIVS